jgi:GntR family transcriptional regulator
MSEREFVDAVRQEHTDDGSGRCVRGCGPYPCRMREWIDRDYASAVQSQVMQVLERTRGNPAWGVLEIDATPDWRPKYLQLADELRMQIETGRLVAGSVLPTEAKLRETYTLSRASVRQAIRQLREWGLVRSTQGRGTYVRTLPRRVVIRPAARYHQDKLRITSTETRPHTRRAVDTGQAAEIRHHGDYRTVEANDDIAKLFGVPPGTVLAQRIYWTTSQLEKGVLSLSHHYFRQETMAADPKLSNQRYEPWPGGTQHQLATAGIEVVRIVDEISARPPRPEEAELLDAGPGVCVLQLRKMSYDVEGRVVEVADTVLPGDRAALGYETRLRRWRTGT